MGWWTMCLNMVTHPLIQFRIPEWPISDGGLIIVRIRLITFELKPMRICVWLRAFSGPHLLLEQKYTSCLDGAEHGFNEHGTRIKSTEQKRHPLSNCLRELTSRTMLNRNMRRSISISFFLPFTATPSEWVIIIKEWNCVNSYHPSYLHIFVNKLVSNWLLFNFRFLSPRISRANKYVVASYIRYVSFQAEEEFFWELNVDLIQWEFRELHTQLKWRRNPMIRK